ncbi:MAG: hypothetical protein MJ227_00425 [Bacilli bacterium]|nr:hypothetical protein [Bacilli bacterium]
MKNLLLLPLLSISLTSCGNWISKGLTIISPTGAPAIAFYNHYANSAFETNSIPGNIVAMMVGKNAKDIVVIDITSGISAINQGVNYKLAACLTFGNFYLCGTGNDENKQLNPGDKIILFKRHGLPDIVFHYLYGNEYDSQIQYVDSAATASTCLAKGKDLNNNPIDYVFLAEPAVTTVLNNKQAPTYGKSYVYRSIQEDFKEKSGKDMIQASIFINNNVTKSDAVSFLNGLQKDIAEGILNPSVVKECIEKDANNRYGMTPDQAYNCLLTNTIGLGFKDAYEMKDDIDNFVTLFGLEKTHEEIYFK